MQRRGNEAASRPCRQTVSSLIHFVLRATGAPVDLRSAYSRGGRDNACGATRERPNEFRAQNRPVSRYLEREGAHCAIRLSGDAHLTVTPSRESVSTMVEAVRTITDVRAQGCSTSSTRRLFGRAIRSMSSG